MLMRQQTDKIDPLKKVPGRLHGIKMANRRAICCHGLYGHDRVDLCFFDADSVLCWLFVLFNKLLVR